MKGNRARSFVMIMVIIAVSAFLFRIAIGRIIKLSIVQNESTAVANLKLIAAALEKYAEDYEGAYPLSLAVLAGSEPSYIDKDYSAKPDFKGYNYNCPRLDKAGYSCSAIPVKCGITGNLAYTVTTGSLLISEGCGRRNN